MRRLSLSKYTNNLVLKGGLLLFVLTGFESRATIDVDFLLRQIPCSVEDVRRIILVKWWQFLKRTKLPDIEFREVTGLLNTFLGGIWSAIVNENEWHKTWHCQTTSW